MEELQDAIEDAQYVNAIATQEEGPRPVLSWEIPTEEQLASWEHSKNIPFTLEWTMSRAIGLFLFSAYCKEDRKDYLRINFAEEVARWKTMKGKHRVERAKKIVQVYLKPPPVDRDGRVVLPKRTEIDEYDLIRTNDYAVTPSIYDLNTVPKDEMDDMMMEAQDGPQGDGDARTNNNNNQKFDEDDDDYNGKSYHSHQSFHSTHSRQSSGTFNCLGVHGPVVDQVFQTLRDMDRATLLRTSSSGSTTPVQRKSAPPNDLQFRSSELPESGDQLSDKLSQRNSTSNITALKSHKERYTSLKELTLNMKQKEAANLANDIFDQVEAIVVESLKRDYWKKFVRESEHFTKLRNFMWFQDRTVVPDDFFTMRVLGRGGFGLVTACKKGTSGKLYAMKVMNKKRIKLKKSEALAVNERKALAAVESPFVVNLKYSFHSTEDVYLILDLMTGGDLGYHLHQKGKFPKKECQYYGARIMLGLQALHDKGYVYRDLKPENCLLDEDGRVKITDLGLATKITPKLHGAAGTRGYWAPEMLRRDKNGKRLPYGHTVDWFSFGCCMAEFISGGNPFRSEAALNFGLERGKETKEKAIDHATMEMEPEFPESLFEPDAADFCRNLLDKNEKNRLGTNGCEEIMAHPWFKNMNWESIISDRKRPPFVPPKDVNAASQSEIGNFTEDKKLQECIMDAKDESYYKDWDWTNPHAYAAEVIEFLIYERETGEPLVPISQQSACCCDIL